MRVIFVSLLCCSLHLTSVAQDTLPVPANIQAAFAKQTRSKDGMPGPKYWQNSADYIIEADFEPRTRLLSGKVNIIYRNNSPDTLRELWFKLNANLYKKGTAPQSIKPADQGEGLVITEASVNRTAKDITTLRVDGTNMITQIEPLLPGKTVQLNFVYHYTLNKGSHVRTGQVDSGSYFIAYFFPRVAVYDDVDGWNKYQYTGAEEFYNDFCNFRANITVPENFVVWATGDLQNAKTVLNKKFADRIRSAANKNDIVYVIDSTDLRLGNITKQGGRNTWRFKAENVTDFVFALSDHYLWQSTSVMTDPKTRRRTRVDAVFNPIHKDYYEVIDFARKTVDLMSYKFPAWPFPYSHETIFDGLDQMEYPMMVNDNPTDKREDAITLTDHEIFHTMFPFYMGINETKYAWMDEGWATIGEWILSSLIEPKYRDDYGISATAKTSGEKDDTPIMTITTDLKRSAYFTNCYPKPGFGYLYIKDYLGDELFQKALHHYIRTWQGKHPMPFDFFYSMNKGSGKNMDWFWKRWFFEGGVLDLAIQNVAKSAIGYTITVENKSSKPLPVDLLVTYSDGSQGVFHENISVWQLGNQSIKIDVPTEKVIKSAVLGSFYTPDKNPNDNTYKTK